MEYLLSFQLICHSIVDFYILWLNALFVCCSRVLHTTIIYLLVYVLFQQNRLQFQLSMVFVCRIHYVREGSILNSTPSFVLAACCSCQNKQLILHIYTQQNNIPDMRNNLTIIRLWFCLIRHLLDAIISYHVVYFIRD